jgi:DNA/RNA endonuclease YhcR with UshA esterase domain
MAEYNIEEYVPQSGRIIKEDNTVVNIADCYVEDGSGNLTLRVVAST